MNDTNTLPVPTTGNSGSPHLMPRPTRVELLPPPDDWRTMMDMADAFYKSGLMPPAIKSPAAALLLMQKGRELGVPPAHAIASISIISGKPATSAELMLALIKRDIGPDAMIVEETDAEHCTVSYARPNWTKRRLFSFTLAEAKQAGLLSKPGNWQQYPAAMLRARAISAAARLEFAEVIGGMYTAEELGATVNEAGEILALPHQTGPAVNTSTGEVLENAPPATTRAPLPPARDEHEHLMRCLHMEAKDRLGWGHEEIKLLGQHVASLTGRTAPESMSDWTPQSLAAIRNLINTRPVAELTGALILAREPAAAPAAAEPPNPDTQPMPATTAEAPTAAADDDPFVPEPAPAKKDYNPVLGDPQPKGPTPEPAPAMRDLLRAQREYGLGDSALINLVGARYGVESLAELTSGSCYDLISHIRANYRIPALATHAA